MIRFQVPAAIRARFECFGAVPTSADACRWAGWLERAFHERPHRWRHVEAVWKRGEELQKLGGIPGISAIELRLVELACLLHDVGRVFDPDDAYPHALVGGAFLLDLGFVDAATLVAWHSGAAVEAELRGIELDVALRTFPRARSELHALVGYLDMTSGPSGEPMTLDERLADIKRRYGARSFQARAFEATWDEFHLGERIAKTRGS